MHLLRLPFTAQGALALLALLAVGVSGQNCQVRPRREFRDLSSTEWQGVVSSMRGIQRSGEFDRIVRLHVDHQRVVHNGPNFLPWHRYYILRFERAMQQIDASVMLPYWNWAYDSQAPETSLLFTDAYLGGNGQGDGRCVQDGQFRDWRPANPRPHCLTRDWDLGDRISSLYGVEVINRIVADSRVYETFRTGLEGAPHGAVHNNIGADFATMVSPNDPIFWLHHAFVDKIWADWQRRHPDLANTYGGTNRDGTPGRLTDSLISSEYTVAGVMDTRALCYEYAELQNTSGPATPPSDSTPPQTPTTPTTPEDDEDDDDEAPVPGETREQRQERRRQRRRERRQRQRERERRQRERQNGRLVRRFEAAYGEKGAMPNDFTGGYSMIPVKSKRNITEPCDTDEEPRVVTVPYTEDAGPRRVSYADRSDLLAIRTPRPLPTRWIQMQGMNVTEFRDEEGKLSRVCALVNSLKGYASPAALLNRRDVLQLLTKKRNRFYAIAEGKNITLTGYTDANAVAQLVHVPKQLSAVQDAWQTVEQVIGKIVYPEVAAVLPSRPKDDCSEY